MKNIVIAGNVTRDAELREHKGTPVLKFSVAVQDGYGANKSVLYFDCAYWGKAAQAIVSYVKKGIKISVSGEFSMRIYNCLLYTSPSPRDRTRSRMPSSA